MEAKSAFAALQQYLVDPEDIASIQHDESVFKLTYDDKDRIADQVRSSGLESFTSITKGDRTVYQRDPRIFSGPDESYLRYLFAPDTLQIGEAPECAPEYYEALTGLPAPTTGWPLKEERIAIPLDGPPERIALALLSQSGWVGAHSEGHAIRTIFRALLLPYLCANNPFKCIGSEKTPMTHTIHALIPMVSGPINMSTGAATIDRERIADMHRAIDQRLALPAQVIQADFDLISDIASSLWPKIPGRGFAVDKFLSAIRPEFWHQLLEIYAMNKWHLAHGWPDLELSNGKEVVLVEVKVKDRLTTNQKQTIPILMGMGMTCRLVRLIR